MRRVIEAEATFSAGASAPSLRRCGSRVASAATTPRRPEHRHGECTGAVAHLLDRPGVPEAADGGELAQQPAALDDRVPGVGLRLARHASTTSRGAQASRTLPTPVACSGKGTPGRLSTGTELVPRIGST